MDLEQSTEVKRLKDGNYETGSNFLLTRNNDQVLRIEMLKSGWNADALEIVTPSA